MKYLIFLAAAATLALYDLLIAKNASSAASKVTRLLAREPDVKRARR